MQSNHAHTLAIVTRLRALHPECKPEWWRRDFSPHACECQKCVDARQEMGLSLPFVYIGPPDLSARECLADLWEVCDQLADDHNYQTFTNALDLAFCECVLPSEHLLAAAEAALGAGEEVAGEG